LTRYIAKYLLRLLRPRYMFVESKYLNMP